MRTGRETRAASQLTDSLRQRILTALHHGTIEAGVRLSGVRSLAAELHADPRAVMASQQELAAALHIRQASVSKAMRRRNADFQVSTLQRVIHAMGGRLRLVAEFPNEPAVEIVDSSEDR